MKTDPAEFGGGRRQLYSADGIKRLMCSKAGCGNEAYSTWGICADGNIQRPMCIHHDVQINAMVLKWMGDPEWYTKTTLYILNLQFELGIMIETDWLDATL